MSRPSQVIVLVEDATHQQFVRHYLYSAGYTIHDIRFVDLPAGGSGEQYVKQKYPEELQAYRRRVQSRRATTALVVVIDADTSTVRHRMTEFRSRLLEAGLKAIHKNERVVHLIPKRNIETWILYLRRGAADEGTDYKPPDRNRFDDSIQPAAEKLRRWYLNPDQRPPDCIPSLNDAFPELSRLDVK